MIPRDGSYKVADMDLATHVDCTHFQQHIEPTPLRELPAVSPTVQLNLATFRAGCLKEYRQRLDVEALWECQEDRRLA